MRNLIFWGLFPFALPQAIYVRRRAPRFAPPPCEPRGIVGAGDPLRVIGIGDSVIAGVGMGQLRDAFVGQTTLALADALGRAVHWSVHGRSGARVQTLLDDYVPQLPAEEADVILLSVGVNDITGMTLLPVFGNRLRVLLETLRAHSPRAVIGVAGVPPLGGFPLLPEPLRFASGQRGRAFDSAARRVAARFPGVVHMPVEFETSADNFCDDGFHPSEISHAKFGRLMAELIAAELQRGAAWAENGRDDARPRSEPS
jgi:lysophospholipase L1-like esterase